MIYRYGGPHMRGYGRQQSQTGTKPSSGAPSMGRQSEIPAQPQDPYGNIVIPTQPSDMGRKLENRKREEVSVLLVLMFLAVFLSIGICIAVYILRQFSGPVFKIVEESGVSIDSLKSLSSIGRIRVGGKAAIGVILAVALLSRGATTVLYAMIWGIADITSILVSVSFFRNSAKKRSAAFLEYVSVFLGLFTIAVSLYTPYEIWTHWREAGYWIPGSENSVSIWVMLPSILWGSFLLIYLIVSVFSWKKGQKNNVKKPTEDSVS